LGSEELQLAKKNLGWPSESTFFVSDAVHAHFRQALTQGRHFEDEWEKSYDRYAQMWRKSADEFDRRLAGKLPEKWDDNIASCLTDTKLIATRKTSEAVMQVLAARVPEFMGGSADLNPSTFTWLKGCGDFQSPETPHDGVEGAVGDSWGYHGRNVHFGVREHAMGAIAAGMALHGGIIPYTATFLTFSDYMRPPMRLAALMGIQVIYIFTHDSIALGEDGPTHQPIEQLMNLRAVPNLTLIRPADAAETVEAWRAAMLNKKGPTALIFTRQNVPVLERKELSPAEGLHRGGYILWQSSPEKPDIILIGAGSEVNIAMEAGKTLASEGIRVRVVSLPSWEIFDRQPAEYRQDVLPSEVKARIAIEAGIKLGWERYVGLDGAIVGMDGFGASAPAQVLYEKFGITKEHTVRLAKMLVKR
jgi:transketolase